MLIAAFGYALDGRLAPIWMSIPEVGASAPQAIAAFIKEMPISQAAAPERASTPKPIDIGPQR